MNLTAMIETGAANPVVLFAVALILGALHGLEPGHSKTMMAAYLVAVRGTVSQAVLLGLSAAFSHVIIVWVLALAALSLGDELIGDPLEPYFMIVSGVLILASAGWMLRNTLRERAGHAHRHDTGHSHGHDAPHGHNHSHGHGHHNVHHNEALEDDVHLDAHARAHAADIRARLASGKTGAWQTMLFGFSGGLVPCPAAITIAIVCLHLGKLTLGVTLVGAFSLGLAATLVVIGVVAAVGLSYAATRSHRIDALIALAPWVSVGMIAFVGVVMIAAGALHMGAHH